MRNTHPAVSNVNSALVEARGQNSTQQVTNSIACTASAPGRISRSHATTSATNSARPGTPAIVPSCK